DAYWAKVIFLDNTQRSRLAGEDCAASRIGNGDLECFVPFDNKVVENGNSEGSAGLPVADGYPATGRDIILSGRSRAVLGSIIECDHARCSVGSKHRDEHCAGSFAGEIFQGTERKNAGVKVVVDDAQRGVRGTQD